MLFNLHMFIRWDKTDKDNQNTYTFTCIDFSKSYIEIDISENNRLRIYVICYDKEKQKNVAVIKTWIIKPEDIIYYGLGYLGHNENYIGRTCFTVETDTLRINARTSNFSKKVKHKDYFKNLFEALLSKKLILGPNNDTNG